MQEQIKKIISDICPFYKEYGSCEKCDEEMSIEDEPCYWACVAKVICQNGYRKQKEGEWIEYEDDFWTLCSECGWEIWDEFGDWQTPYCPNCGAKMKGGAE